MRPCSAKGGSVRLLRLEKIQLDRRKERRRRKQGLPTQWRVIYRMFFEDQLDFLELVIETESGRPPIKDLCLYSAGCSLSHQVKDIVVLALKDSGTSVITKISDEYYKVREFVRIGCGGKPQEALDCYAELPRELQINRTVLVWRVCFAEQVSPREFVKAVAEMRRGFDDPRLEILFQKVFRMKGEHERALASLERLDEFVGGDAYLLYLQARIYPRLEQEARARERLEQAHELEPTLEQPLIMLLGFALRAQDHAKTLVWVEKLQALGNDFDFTLPRYADFVESDEFKKWREQRRRTP